MISSCKSSLRDCRSATKKSATPPSVTVLNKSKLSSLNSYLTTCRYRAAEQLLNTNLRSGQRGISVSASASFASSDQTPENAEETSALERFFSALYKFSRPHTMAGTTISILSISMLAIQKLTLTTAVLSGLGYALAAALLMNISIVGTNQLYDIEIDKVNKPYLPLASGEFTVQTGNLIVGFCTLVSFAIGWISGSPALMATLVISWLLGLAYSADIPFLRWKRSPLLAATCILSIRAIAVQLGFYWHMRFSMGCLDGLSSFSWGSIIHAVQSLPLPVAFTVGFMLLFSIVIALFKDIPDAKGDLQAGLQTLTVRMGVAAPFWSCIWILTAAYVGACGYSVVTAAASAPLGAMISYATAGSAVCAGAQQAVMPASLSLGAASLPVKALISIFGHGMMTGLLWRQALKVLRNMRSSTQVNYGDYTYYEEYVQKE